MFARVFGLVGDLLKMKFKLSMFSFSLVVFFHSFLGAFSVSPLIQTVLSSFCVFFVYIYIYIYIFFFFLLRGFLVVGWLVFILFQVSVSVLLGSLFSSRKDFRSGWVGWLRCWVPGSSGGCLSCFGSGSWECWVVFPDFSKPKNKKVITSFENFTFCEPSKP